MTLADLPCHQQQALAAYERGFISLGKLAETMGVSILEIRGWLAEHAIPHNCAFSKEDAELL